ncbi:MAG: putative hydrolase [Ilumatobacteraceae bacterium]|nr:putative hydrolase [Ilumatobacteraceae bacterium]
MGDMSTQGYDEFGLFHENVSEFGLVVGEAPTVSRVETVLPSDSNGRTVSALLWGKTEPQLVLIHGGAQNAHTWDTVALALGVPLLAIDLPGHGHSGWRDDGAYTPPNLADDVAEVIRRHAPHAKAVVGMSLGGLTSLELAHLHPELVRQLVLVDITPGVNQQKAKAVIDFVNGPQTFPSFDELLARTKEHNPTRSESSLRRGILHNAHQTDDGSWQWNYDRRGHARSGDAAEEPTHHAVAYSPLWDHLGGLQCPVTLLRGSLSPVVDDDDVAEATRRQPGIRVDVVDGAGHSIQGDRPVELAALLREIVL